MEIARILNAEHILNLSQLIFVSNLLYFSGESLKIFTLLLIVLCNNLNNRLIIRSV